MIIKRSLFLLFFLTIFFVPIFQTNAASPIKILLVPGHDNEVWGAQYGNLKEADMNLFLATLIFNILKQDKRFEVYITRDSNGYTKEFADYFNNHQADIASFLANAKAGMQKDIDSGKFVQKPNAAHNTASEDIALRLYGFNKWADENKIDAMIHIHFNDIPRPSIWAQGIYRGFTIYMPDSQFVNALGSTNLAKSIFLELHKKYIT